LLERLTPISPLLSDGKPLPAVFKVSVYRSVQLLNQKVPFGFESLLELFDEIVVKNDVGHAPKLARDSRGCK
jgi:hypothetical protein